MYDPSGRFHPPLDGFWDLEPPSNKISRGLADADRPKPRRRSKSRNRKPLPPTLARSEAGLLINYGPALLENMTEADLAAIPDWIQKSSVKIRKHTNTEKQKLLKVIWDSGASISISHDRADFVGPIDESPNERLSSLADGVAVAGRGHVAWSFLDTKGMLRTLKLPAYYVPASGMRLLSTTSLLQHYPNEFLMGDQRGLRLSGTFGPLEAGIKPTNGVEAAYDPQMNLPVAYAFDYDGSKRPSGLISSFNGSSSADRDASNAFGASSGVLNGVLYGVSASQRGDKDSGVSHDRGDSSGHGSVGHCWHAEFSSVQDGSRDPHLWQCWLVGSNGLYGTPSSCHDTSESSNEPFIRQNLAYPTVTPSQPATPAASATDATNTSPSPPWMVSAENSNLTDAEKELLRWHYRLGHLSFRRIQFLMQSGALAASESARRLHTACARLINPPMCAACQFAKQRQRPAPGAQRSVV
jgi:hypothetical protein